MSDAKVFFAGIPTKIDVNRLLEMWPMKDMKAGDIYEYSDIAEIIGVSVKSTRFRTVTNAWRNHVERETGARIIPDGTGTVFKVLSEPEKLEAVKDKQQSIHKQTRKNYARGAYIIQSKLDDDQRKELEFMTDYHKKILSVMQLKTSERITYQE